MENRRYVNVYTARFKKPKSFIYTLFKRNKLNNFKFMLSVPGNLISKQLKLKFFLHLWGYRKFTRNNAIEIIRNEN